MRLLANVISVGLMESVSLRQISPDEQTAAAGLLQWHLLRETAEHPWEIKCNENENSEVDSKAPVLLSPVYFPKDRCPPERVTLQLPVWIESRWRWATVMACRDLPTMLANPAQLLLDGASSCHLHTPEVYSPLAREDYSRN